MRAAYITMQFPAPTETFACSDVEALRQLGVEVHVFTLRPAHARHKALVEERGLADVPISVLTLRRGIAGLAQALRRPLETRRLLWWIVSSTWRKPLHLLKSLLLLPGCLAIAKDLEVGNYGVIHLFWGHYPAIVGWLAKRHRPRPTISMFLGAYDLLLGYGPSHDIARSADLVVTHARANTEDITALDVGHDRIRVIYRGLPSVLFTQTDASHEHHRDPLRVLSVARLIPDKRVEEVLEVFASVAPLWPEASLVVLGEGPQRPALEKLARSIGIERQISFRGHVSRDEVLNEMRRSSALLMLSTKDSERLPNVVKEAMVAGCVPVVARTPGIDELVLNGVSGFIVEPDRLTEAGAYLDRIFTGKDLDSLRSAGHAHVRESFNAALTMQEYVRAWKTAERGRAAEVPQPTTPRDGKPDE